VLHLELINQSHALNDFEKMSSSKFEEKDQDMRISAKNETIDNISS